MTTDRDYYQILQVSPKADPAVVKAAYYTHLKTLRKHPDLGGNDGEAALLNEAYEVLGDREKRKEYDRLFKQQILLTSTLEANPLQPKTELRRHPRAAFFARFRFYRQGEGHRFDAHFLDISLSGACFRSQEKFKKGEELHLDISDHPKLESRAKVIWVRMIPQRFGRPLYEGGAEFQQIDPTALRTTLQQVGLQRLC